MKNNISVNKAIRVGRFYLKFLPIFIVLVLFFTTIYFATEYKFKPLLIFSLIILSFIFGKLYWCFAVTRWQIWAFSNVRNVNELRRKATERQLIWEEGTFYDKLLIKTKIQKIKLEELESKFLIKDKKDSYNDDETFPYETTIYFSLKSNIYWLFIGVLIVILGVYIVFFDKEMGSEKIFLFLTLQDFAIGDIMIGLFLIKIKFNQTKNRKPQITLNEKGIELQENGFMQWQGIENEMIIDKKIGLSSLKHLEFDYDEKYFTIDINDLNISSEKLEKALQTYRLRYEKSK